MKTESITPMRRTTSNILKDVDFYFFCRLTDLHDIVTTVTAKNQRFARLIIALLLAIGPMASLQTGAASSDPVTFVVSSDVAEEDAIAVEEGITLAQNYLLSELGFIPEIRLFVNIRNTSDTTGSHSTAFFSPGFLAVFTGSPGWTQISPFDRIHVVAHEYIHAFQYAVAGDNGYQLPSWFIEGMAEYLSFDAVIKQGLVAESDVLDFHTREVASQPKMEDLPELESADAFYNAHGPVYSLGHLALNSLMADRLVLALYLLMKIVGEGTEWSDAFGLVFGLSPEAFYEGFSEYRDELIAPTQSPAPFDSIEPRDNETTISVELTSLQVGVNDQFTIVAHSEPGSICELRARGLEGESSSSRITFADGSGRLFWLVTIPADVDEDLLTMTVSCGGSRTSIVLPFVQHDFGAISAQATTSRDN